MVKDTLAVRENFDDEDDDDLSDDVEDEVFVRDGGKIKKIPKMEKLRRDEQPLMPVRRKSKPQIQNVSSPDVCNRQPCNIYNCLLPVYFAVATIISIAFFMLFYIFLVNKLPLAVGKFHFWPRPTNGQFDYVVAPCPNPQLRNIWSEKIPELTSNTQLTLIDIDKDNVSDIVIGIGAESMETPPSEEGCEFDFEESEMSCSGGVFAFNGKDGKIMWRRWLPKVVLAVHCDFEITGDSIPDCVVTGKYGLFIAINGADGSMIWDVSRKPVTSFELYSILITRDINRDNYLDIIAGHYAHSKGEIERSGIFLINGRDGNVLRELSIPLYEPILHAPQIIIGTDGEENVCFVTGHAYRKGGIYIISLSDLIQGDNRKITSLYRFDSGILAAPVFADVNLDVTPDIIFIASNSVLVLDGKNFTQIWNASLYKYVDRMYRITATSSITPGYFNEDSIPDILVTVSVGSDFPEFYYSVLLVLDGRTGEFLLGEPVIRSSIQDTVGGITLSFSGTGNDAFVYWSAFCTNHVDSKNTFTFAEKNKNQLFADLCTLRFNSTTQLKLYALNRHIEPPGVPLFSAESHFELKNDLLETIEEERRLSPVFFEIPKRNERFRSLATQRFLSTNTRGVTDTDHASNDEENDWRIGKLVQNLRQNADEIRSSSKNNFLTGLNDNESDDIGSDSRREKVLRNVRRVSIGNGNKFDIMIPKVSASGIITKPAHATDEVDLILMYQEIKADSDVCIIIDSEEKCAPNKKSTINAHRSNDRTRESENDDAIMSKNIPYERRKKIDPKFSVSSNLFISRYHVSCKCEFLRKGEKEKCSLILPFEEQGYPNYQGRYGNSAFNAKTTFSS